MPKPWWSTVSSRPSAPALSLQLPLALAGVLWAAGCGGESDCDAGFGLAADGKCYPIYDPFNPPWGTPPSADDTGSGGGAGGEGGGSGDGGGASGDGTAGSGDGGDGGAGDGSGDGGTPAPPRVEGTYGVSATADITSGSEVWVAVWSEDIGDAVPSTPPIGEASLTVLAAGDTAGFEVELTSVPPDGTDVWVAAVLVQDDGDLTDDPFVVWGGNPGFVTPVDAQTGVTLLIE